MGGNQPDLKRWTAQLRDGLLTDLKTRGKWVASLPLCSDPGFRTDDGDEPTAGGQVDFKGRSDRDRPTFDPDRIRLFRIH